LNYKKAWEYLKDLIEYNEDWNMLGIMCQIEDGTINIETLDEKQDFSDWKKVREYSPVIENQEDYEKHFKSK
jgi:hypothetical protein